MTAAFETRHRSRQLESGDGKLQCLPPGGATMDPSWIPDELFAEFVATMPQVCVEVFLEHDDGVLVGKRANEPAKGEWFWPGGRLYKGERLEAAPHRVAAEELGVEIDVVGQLGVYEHFWESSPVCGSPSRHTVNVVYRAGFAEADWRIELDDQHDDVRFVDSIEPGLHEYVQHYLRDSGVVE